MKCGKYDLKIGKRTYIMGILNVTPDSFSDGGKFNSLERAIAHAKKMVLEGADIIDVGGESTRPGTNPTPKKVELRRVIPVIKRLVEETDVPISIDTYKSEVAKHAIDLGANMINDVAFKINPKIAEVAAKYDVPLVIMHMKGKPKNMQKNPQYKDVIGEIKLFLKDCAEYAINMGVDSKKIIIDPGIGFGKTTEHNLEILRRLKEFKSLNYPILIGPSRKSFIGNVLGTEVYERLEGTLASVAISIMNGADIIRVHDVLECVRVARLTDAIIREKNREIDI